MVETSTASSEITNQVRMIDNKYKFDELFGDDYFHLKWTHAEKREIYWRAETDTLAVIADQPYLVDALPISDETKVLYAKAFELWDEHLDLLEFVETYDPDKTDIAIAVVNELPKNSFGMWSATFEGNLFQKANIQIKEDILDQPLFLTVLLHEIGNVIGLGDISPRSDIRSVQEDPFPEFFVGDTLWSDDAAMANQLYSTQHINIHTNTLIGKELNGITLIVSSERTEGVQVYECDGAAEFDWNHNDHLSVEAQLDYEYHEGAIDISDVLHILQLSVGLGHNSPTEHFEYIAADFNRDTKVTSDDALQVMMYSLGLQTQYNAGWVFLDVDQKFSDINKQNVRYGEGLNFSTNTYLLDLKLTGILLGDADLSHVDLLL